MPDRKDDDAARDKSAMLILREACYGTTRSTTSAAGSALPRQPRRHGSTSSSTPGCWRHLPTRSRLRLAHAGCGAEATVEPR
jgi:hypothetical protein